MNEQMSSEEFKKAFAEHDNVQADAVVEGADKETNEFFDNAPQPEYKAMEQGEDQQQQNDVVEPSPKQEHMVPISVMIAERKEAQEKAERRAQAEMQELRRQMQEMQSSWQKSREPQQSKEIPDPLIDPQGYSQYYQSQIEQRLNEFSARQESQRVEYSLQRAAKQHGEKFNAAYEAGLNADPVTRQRILNSYDPGEELISWHKQQETLAKTGGDLETYRSSLEQELLKDPSFLQKAMQAARQNATPAAQMGQQPPRPHISMPSLSKAPSAGSGLRAKLNDASWQDVMEMGKIKR